MTTPIKVDMAFALKEWWKRMTRKIPKLVKHTGLMSLRISFWSIIGQKMVVRSRGLFNQSMGRASITVERNLPTVDHRIISILNLSASVRLFPVEKPTDSNTFFLQPSRTARISSICGLCIMRSFFTLSSDSIDIYRMTLGPFIGFGEAKWMPSRP